jgi:hypothetical protein
MEVDPRAGQLLGHAQAFGQEKSRVSTVFPLAQAVEEA